MALFKPFWEKKWKNMDQLRTNKKRIDRMEDYPKLLRIAQTSPVWDYRVSAIGAMGRCMPEEEKPRVAELLLKEVYEKEALEKCEGTLDRLEDEDLWAKIASESGSPYLSRAAADRLTDRKLIEGAARRTRHRGVLIDFLRKGAIQDQTLLCAIADGTASENPLKEDRFVSEREIRLAALYRINDPERIAALAKKALGNTYTLYDYVYFDTIGALCDLFRGSETNGKRGECADRLLEMIVLTEEAMSKPDFEKNAHGGSSDPNARKNRFRNEIRKWLEILGQNPDPAYAAVLRAGIPAETISRSEAYRKLLVACGTDVRELLPENAELKDLSASEAALLLKTAEGTGSLLRMLEKVREKPYGWEDDNGYLRSRIESIKAVLEKAYRDGCKALAAADGMTLYKDQTVYGNWYDDDPEERKDRDVPGIKLDLSGG
jgi:hypothetical protein